MPLLLQAFAELGRTLGVLHTSVGTSGLIARRPWVLDLPLGRIPAPLEGDEGVAAVVDGVLSSLPLKALLAVMGRAWTPRTPIHGDIKADNILVVPRHRGAPDCSIRLIDWELSGLGEPSWDLAGIVSGLLSAALATGPDVNVARAVDPARATLAAYAEVTGSLPVVGCGLAEAVIAHLAQSAVQYAAMRHADPHCADQADRCIRFAAALACDPAPLSVLA
jgi:hypothetical protein